MVSWEKLADFLENIEPKAFYIYSQKARFANR